MNVVISLCAGGFLQVTRDEFLITIERINVWRQHGGRAPHKPLLLLLALGRMLGNRERLVLYREIEKPLKELLRGFGKPRRTNHPEYPFGRLCADGLWEVPGNENLSRTRKGDLLVRELRNRSVRGGFPTAIHDLLLSRPEVALEASGKLLQRHFPPSLHDDIRAAVGIPHRWEVRDAPIRSRDPAFRNEVLREYQRRCAVCEFDVRLGDELIGLEAAHIKWHSHGGPDEVRNGLALCGLHHKALDKGALGLEPSPSGFNVLISSEVTGLPTPIKWFLDYHGRSLRLPLNPEFTPAPEFVCWHQREVFRKPALPRPTI